MGASSGNILQKSRKSRHHLLAEYGVQPNFFSNASSQKYEKRD